MATLGRYEIEREIGRGTMGVVYLALDTRLRRRVALKVWTLPQGLGDAQQQEAQRRFVREAQAAAGLADPGIVTVFDVDRDAASGRLYIAMEFVAGRTLDQVLASAGPPPLDRSLEIVTTLADALGAAHDAGIVHRDVKPANVLVRDEDGAIKLADFGVARIDSSSLTQPGTSIGSPAYMSPEQARGRELDGRSDLFSLASILYELLTGVRAFPGQDATAVLYALIHEPVRPPSELRPGIPEEIDAFLVRALSKDANERFPDARAFRDALAQSGGRSDLHREPSKLTPHGEASDQGPVVDAGGQTVAVDTTGRTVAGDVSGATVAVDVSGQTVAVDVSGRSVASSASGTAVVVRTSTDTDCVSPRPREAADDRATEQGSCAGRTDPRRPRPGRLEVSKTGPVPADATLAAPPDANVAEPPSRARPGVGAPRRAWSKPTVAAIALVLLGALVAAVAWRASPDPAVLDLEGRSNNVAGLLEITVDGDPVFERRLSAPPSRALLRRIVRKGTEGFEARIEVPAGHHEIAARLTTPDGDVHLDSVSLEFEPGETRVLQVRAGRLFGSPLSIRAN